MSSGYIPRSRPQTEVDRGDPRQGDLKPLNLTPQVLRFDKAKEGHNGREFVLESKPQQPSSGGGGLTTAESNFPECKCKLLRNANPNAVSQQDHVQLQRHVCVLINGY